MVDKIALAKTGLRFATRRKSKHSKKDDKAKTPKPGDNPFYYVEVVHDRSGQPKLDTRGRPVTKERRKDLEYYVHKLGIPEEDAKILLKMKSRAILMDGGRKVMGIRTPFGLSTVLTFCVPEIGDGLDGLISYIMVVKAGKISGGLGARNHAAMTLNVGRDFAIGTIPFAGAIVDMFYRANTRNSNMLEKVLIERVKKAQLNPNASYESSLLDSSSDDNSVRSGHTMPRRTTGRGDHREHADAGVLEAPAPSRSNTLGLRTEEHSKRSNRRFDDFVDRDPPKATRANTGASKKASKSLRSQSENAGIAQTFKRGQNGPSVEPQGGRFISAKDL